MLCTNKQSVVVTIQTRARKYLYYTNLSDILLLYMVIEVKKFCIVYVAKSDPTSKLMVLL